MLTDIKESLALSDTEEDCAAGGDSSALSETEEDEVVPASKVAKENRRGRFRTLAHWHPGMPVSAERKRRHGL